MLATTRGTTNRTEDLIVDAGPQIGALAQLFAVRADGTSVELPEIKVLFEQGGTRVRFLPDGDGLVYMQGTERLQDFYLLDLTSMQSRRLTRLENPAEMRTFDIAPDGSEIVFDRLRRNSYLVLIDFERQDAVCTRDLQPPGQRMARHEPHHAPAHTITSRPVSQDDDVQGSRCGPAYIVRRITAMS